MSVELHLPDLPEIPVALGPLRGRDVPRLPTPWHVRLRDALSSYLPLLLMALLALSTWWLVKNTPRAPDAPEAATARQDPDYTMNQFALQRFGADGRLKLRVDGERMRHFPDTDRIEIDAARLQAWAPDGRITRANARRALSNGDGSEVQLMGGATVTSSGPVGEAIEFHGEFLHAFLATERLSSHLPVQVLRGGSDLRAAGFDYDHLSGKLDLLGPMRMVFPPRVAK